LHDRDGAFAALATTIAHMNIEAVRAALSLAEPLR
jgi:hypothetical protein